MLDSVRSFLYTPPLKLVEWVVSLTLLDLDLVRSFSYILRAGFSEEFLLYSYSWLELGVSLTLLELVLLRSLSYTPNASFSE